MKRKLFSLIFAALCCASMWALDQDTKGYYLLGCLLDWQEFAELVKTTPTANAKMTADINLGNDQTMIGSNNTYPYSGIFDGQGHTLTVAYNNTDAGLYVAPFSYIYGATIRNLHVAGTIQTACQNAGVVSKYGGSGNVVENVWSSLAIQTNWTANSGNWECCSGFVGSTLAGSNASLIMRDCLFTGSVVAASGDQSGCFLGYVDSNCSANVSNCLSLGTYTYGRTSTSVTKTRMSIDNSFVKQFPNTIPADMQLTNEQLADGAIAYNLQANRTDLVWGQRLGTDAEPVLTNDESYRVYISKNGGYTNNPEDAYEGLQQDGEGNYLLGCLRDWQEFVALGNSTAKAKMIADIDLGDDQTKFGGYSSGTGFAGTFDGNGHTLTLHYVENDASSPGCAPFGRTSSSAVFKNLHIAGSITTAGMRPASITSRGSCHIQNCWSSVAISSSRGADIDAGGFAGRVGQDDNIYIEDCIFTGSIEYTDPNASEVGGFIGWTVKYSHQYLDHCLFAPSNLTFSTTNNAYSGMLVGTNYVSGYIQNSYYNSIGNAASILTPQGTYATDEQLADGTIATALQAGRAEEIWVQDGATPMLKIFATTPIEAITANEDPDHAGIYYSTFFDGSVRYELPVGVEAYVATLSNDDLVLTKIAEGGQVMPANTAVILKSDAASIMLTPSTADAVTFTATNSLQGTDVATAAPANCYVLSGHSADNSEIGVGFYQYTGTLKAHRAYVTISNPNSAPKRLRFVFDSATAIENTDADVKAEKRIENGVLYIIKNGVKYNAQGQTVK